ncbi:MAG: LamG domain-containing protein, partial [Rhizonema sp. NSF051]|nr:LamG domain-containing protein [Rhizonema sp. NSF051]
MLTIDKIRVGVAGLSIGTLRRGNPSIDRMMAQQAALSQTTMQETRENESFPTAPTFNGVSDKLDMPYAPELNPACFTVEMWVMLGGGTGYQSIIASVGGSPLEGRKGYLFCVTPSRQWQFWLGNGEQRAFWRVLTGPKVTPGVWTHLAGTYDQHSQTMTFYVDGQEVAREIDVQYHPNDRNPMRVGAGATEQLGASPCFFCGKIAEVHVWDKVLSTREIQALSAQQSIEIQAEPITDYAPDESASASMGQIHSTVKEPSPASKQVTGTQEQKGNAQDRQSMNLVSVQEHKSTITSDSKPSIEKPLASPIVEKPLTPKQPTEATSMSDPPSILWQIGKPGQAGIPVPTGIWKQVYNYTVVTDPDPVNRPLIPSCLVPPSASKIPNSTSQLNIYFVLAEDYTEGQLILCYDRYGSGEDNIFLDGQLIAKTPGADKVKLKQTQIPLGVVYTGPHTLSITVSNSADSAHVIDYLQLQTTKPMLNNLTSQLLPSGNQHPSRGNQQAAQNQHQGGGLGGGLLGGLLQPVTGVVNQATDVVGQAAGAAGLPGELLGQATGLVGGLAGQAAGAAGLPGELLGQATGLVGGLAGQVAGAAGLPGELLGQATGLLSGLAGQAAGAAGLPGELLGQATGLVGGLAGQAAGAAGLP